MILRRQRMFCHCRVSILRVSQNPESANVDTELRLSSCPPRGGGGNKARRDRLIVCLAKAFFELLIGKVWRRGGDSAGANQTDLLVDINLSLIFLVRY